MTRPEGGSISRWLTYTWKRQEGRTQRSLSPGRIIIALWFIVAMVNRLGQLDRLAGMELVLARLVALGSLARNLTAPDWVRVRFARSLLPPLLLPIQVLVNI